MSLQTYWLVVPIVRPCITIPRWPFLRLTRNKHPHKVDE
jgi:hypothetical protein